MHRCRQIARRAATGARRFAMSSFRPAINATLTDAIGSSATASRRLASWSRVKCDNQTRSRIFKSFYVDQAGLGLVVASGAAALVVNATRGEVKADDRNHDLSEDEQRTISLFERCSGSVVHINTFVKEKGLVPGAWGGMELDIQDIPQGTGSGFMWDSEHVVTNFHVIKDADKATIIFSDHTSRDAFLVGAEPDFDLAVLKFENRDGLQIDALSKGTSSHLQVGQKVFAIGNPFGLDQTLTSGIVSGLGREMRHAAAKKQVVFSLAHKAKASCLHCGMHRLRHLSGGIGGRMMRGLVQTDAAINPGNSGGPLLDAKGRLIGVNTMIASPSGAFAGVGFAIPVDAVKRVVEQIIKYGFAKQPYLGLYLLPDHMNQQLSRQMVRQRQKPLEGPLILKLEPGSPADQAGLKPTYQTTQGIQLGDEILTMNGKKVTTTDDVLAAVDGQSIGATVELTYRRRAAGRPQQHSTSLRLAERPLKARQISTRSPTDNGVLAVSGDELRSRL